MKKFLPAEFDYVLMQHKGGSRVAITMSSKNQPHTSVIHLLGEIDTAMIDRETKNGNVRINDDDGICDLLEHIVPAVSRDTLEHDQQDGRQRDEILDLSSAPGTVDSAPEVLDLSNDREGISPNEAVEMMNELEALRDENEQLKERVAAVTLSQQQDEHTKEMEELRSAQRVLQEENKALQQTVADLETAHAAAIEEAHQTVPDEVQAQLQRNDVALEELREQQTKQGSVYDELLSECQGLTDENDALKGTVAELQIRIEALQEDVAASDLPAPLPPVSNDESSDPAPPPPPPPPAEMLDLADGIEIAEGDRHVFAGAAFDRYALNGDWCRWIRQAVVVMLHRTQAIHVDPDESPNPGLEIRKQVERRLDDLSVQLLQQDPLPFAKSLDSLRQTLTACDEIFEDGASASGAFLVAAWHLFAQVADTEERTV